MIRQKLLISVFLIFLFGCTLDRAISDSGQGSMSSRFRIMTMGDSITLGGYYVGNTWTVDGGYRKVLWQNLLDVYSDIALVGSLQNGSMGKWGSAHEGHSGVRIDQLHEKIDLALTTYDPDVVVLMIGTNDVSQSFDLNNAGFRYRNLLEKMWSLKPGVAIVASSIIPINHPSANAAAAQYNSSIRQVVSDLNNAPSAQQGPLYWIDSFNNSGLEVSSPDFADNVHPSPEGYDKLGAAISRELIPLLRTIRKR